MHFGLIFGLLLGIGSAVNGLRFIRRFSPIQTTNLMPTANNPRSRTNIVETRSAFNNYDYGGMSNKQALMYPRVMRRNLFSIPYVTMNTYPMPIPMALPPYNFYRSVSDYPKTEINSPRCILEFLRMNSDKESLGMDDEVILSEVVPESDPVSATIPVEYPVENKTPIVEEHSATPEIVLIKDDTVKVDESQTALEIPVQPELLVKEGSNSSVEKVAAK